MVYLMSNLIIREAEFSDNNKERYLLSRIWKTDKPKLLFIMHNPSNADDKFDDPTVRRLIGFTSKFDYGGFFVANLFTQITSNPKAVDTSKGLTNKSLKIIKKIIHKVDQVVYAWGNKKLEPDELRKIILNPLSFGKNKDGSPKHPLYLNSDSILLSFR